MTRDELLTEIRRQAAENGGRIGLRAFCKASGIPEHQIVSSHFATWNEALQAAEVPTVSFQRPRTDEAVILEQVARLTARLGKWPSENEMKLERRRAPSFPSFPVIRRLVRARTLAPKLAAHCVGRPDLAQVAAIARERQTVDGGAEPRVGRATIEGYVYMMRSGRRYKIGFTSTPARRHREVRLELPDPTDLVHSIPTDDPGGIEAYWHRRFHSKRIRDTEFFNLDATDVAAFKARKYQ